MIIGMSGLKGSGKDTVGEVLVKEFGFTRVAFADAVRDFIYAQDLTIGISEATYKLNTLINEFGWDYLKRNFEEIRNLMKTTGSDAGRNILGEDIWINTLKRLVPDLLNEDRRYVITDCRFPNEAEFVQDINGWLIWVDRPGLQPDGHISETTALRDLANLIITNDSTIEDLQEETRGCLKTLRQVGVL